MTRSSRHASQQPRQRREAASKAGNPPAHPAKSGRSGKGAVIGPSRMPRREESTDPAIGKGEEPVRPRRPQDRKDDVD